MGFSSTGVVIEPPILTEVPPIRCRQPWLVQNRFSPLSVLGNGMEAEFGEGEDHAEERSSTHVDTTQKRSVDFVGEFQSDFGLHLLSGETSGVVVNGYGSGERDIFVLDCEPLSRWEPKDLSEGLLVQDSVVGSQGTKSGPPSNWVSQLMKNFCKMVSFLIVKHETQCLALFRILEQECLKVNDDRVSKRPANSGSQGLRGELKGLISYVNYDGVSSRSRSRASSKAMRVVGSFK